MWLSVAPTPNLTLTLLLICPLLDQRQRWGDTQTHPIVNFSDLFFDLFYVAAAYNLSNIIRQSPTKDGILYFVTCFLAVYMLWWDKTFYDARFFTYDDAFHGVFAVAVLVALASVVLHIRPIAVLSNPTENVEPFALCISLLIANLLSVSRYMEIVFIGCVGQDAAVISSRRDALHKILPIVILCAASIYTGIEFYGSGSEMEEDQQNDDHRVLAGDDKEYGSNAYTTDIPIYLILASSIVHWVPPLIQMFTSSKDFKSVTVPINVDFTIHRYGEWTMLMLGESVLSLLVVESPTNSDYYITFFCGILSVILLQYMHFRSQPSKADDHAMRRKRGSGFAFAFLMIAYSAALIVLGTSYKMLLYEFTYDGSSGRRRSLLPMPRWLAGGDGALAFATEDRQQRIAHFFSASFAVVYFCSDAMILAHRGFKDNMGRCRCRETSKAKTTGVLLVVLRIGICVFMATLSQYEADPTLLSVIGLASIVGQIVLRVVSSIVFADDRVHVDLKEHQEEQEAVEAEQDKASE